MTSNWDFLSNKTRPKPRTKKNIVSLPQTNVQNAMISAIWRHQTEMSIVAIKFWIIFTAWNLLVSSIS